MILNYFSLDRLAIHSSSNDCLLVPRVRVDHTETLQHARAALSSIGARLFPCVLYFQAVSWIQQLLKHQGDTDIGPRFVSASYHSSKICNPCIPAYRTCTFAVSQLTHLATPHAGQSAIRMLIPDIEHWHWIPELVGPSSSCFQITHTFPNVNGFLLWRWLKAVLACLRA
jgi:hypothetical protein